MRDSGYSVGRPGSNDRAKMSNYVRACKEEMRDTPVSLLRAEKRI